MRCTWLVLCACACAGAAPKETAVIDLPSPAKVPDASAPPAESHGDEDALRGSTWTREDLGSWGSSDLVMTVDLEQIRKHPDAARLAAVLAATSQWSGILGPNVDAVRDLDWVRVAGPSLVDTAEDIMVARMSIADAAIDKLLASRGTAFPLPDVKAWKLKVESSEVVVMHVAPSLVAVAPGARAPALARDLVAHAPQAPPLHADEAMRLRALHVSAFVVLLPYMPQGRLWVDAHPNDASADVYFEGDCASEDEARTSADALRERIRSSNSFAVRLLTAGILNRVAVATVGNVVRLRMHATREQIEAVLALAASRVGATQPRTP